MKVKLFIILIILVFAGFFLFKPKDNLNVTVNSFDECVKAGYPILESFPEQCRTPDGKTFLRPLENNEQEEKDPIEEKSELIKIDNLKTNDYINSPITIKGSARLWYFEGSFPVEILDANGKSLAIKPAQAKGEWMTEEFVPFEVTLSFTKPETQTGEIVFKKDNPSDDRTLDDELRVPIRFKDNFKEINLYYYNPKIDIDKEGNILCSEKGIVEVKRTIPISKKPIQDAISLLIKGEITDEEKKLGISTEFPLPGFSLDGVDLKNGVLILNFEDNQNKTIGGSCRVSVLWNQIKKTALQFKEVKTVAFNPETLFQP